MAEYILDKNTAAKLYLYEPGIVAFSISSNRFKRFENVKVNNLGLSNSDGKITFYEQENAGELSSAIKKMGLWSRFNN